MGTVNNTFAVVRFDGFDDYLELCSMEALKVRPDDSAGEPGEQYKPLSAPKRRAVAAVAAVASSVVGEPGAAAAAGTSGRMGGGGGGGGRTSGGGKGSRPGAGVVATAPELVIPEKLKIVDGDDEATRARKKKAMKAMKREHTFATMDAQAAAKANSWKAFQAKGVKGKAKRGTISLGIKKSGSMFKTQEAGKVGVTGSGRGVTSFLGGARAKHQYAAPENED